MSQTPEKLIPEMPSAMPTESQIAAWADMPRDEQARRYQQMFKQLDCNSFTTDTPEDILAIARQQVAARPKG
jgi:hypothetical protein